MEIDLLIFSVDSGLVTLSLVVAERLDRISGGNDDVVIILGILDQLRFGIGIPVYSKLCRERPVSDIMEVAVIDRFILRGTVRLFS